MLKSLKKIKNEGAFKYHILVNLDPIQRETDGIKCIDWKTFLTQL